MIDPTVVKKFNQLMEAARDSNQEPVAVLARWGMLRREQEDGYDALVAAYRVLEAQDAANILRVFTGKETGTPADMFRAVMLWFERYIDAKEKK